MMLRESILLLRNQSQENKPFMHLDDLRLATDLWMNRHGKDEAVIGLVRVVKLLEP